MARGIKDKVAILGMGCSKFGERWDSGAEELMLEAYKEAIADAGIDPNQLNAAWFSTFVLAGWGLRRRRPLAVLIVLFFALGGGVGNGVAHLLLNRRIVLGLSFGLFVFAAATLASAQTQSSQPAPAVQPSASNAGSEKTSGQDSAAQPPPAKKVWTNEDMANSQGQPEISTFKSGNPKNANAAVKQKPAGAHDPAWYRDQIMRLQTQVAQLDKQIADLQSALEGKPTGDATQSTCPAGVKWDSWQHELDQAKQKREDLLDKISALHDDARHNGVNPNQLP